MLVATIMGMVALTFLFGGVEERQRNPNASPDSIIHDQQIEVRLKQNRMGHYVTTGEINRQEVEFLLDTGATDVVVPEELARRLKLPRGHRGRAMTANGPVTIYNTRIDELAIGEIRLYDIEASINPSMEGAILLGMSALRQVEFTQRDKILTLTQWAD